MKNKLRLSILLGACAFLFAIASISYAAAPSTAPGKNKIICFSGSEDYPGLYFGTCTMNSNGAKGPATLNNVDEDTDPYNNYSGVYVENNNIAGTLLSDVSHLSFMYSGDDATAGSPRFSLAVQDGDGTDLGHLFISAYYCNDGAGLVDAINDPTCTIYTSFSSESFDNWADLVATYPEWEVADTDYPAYIVADDPGVWTVSGVTLGKPGK